MHTSLLPFARLSGCDGFRSFCRLLAGCLLFACLPTGLYAQKTEKKQNSGREATFFIRFEAGKRPAAANAKQVFKEKLGLGADDELVRGKTERDPQGFTHERYEQRYKGVPVEYGVLKAHSRNGAIESITGERYAVSGLGVQPGLSEKDALQRALAFVGARQYRWQNAAEEEFLKKESKNPKATAYPKGQLVICRDYLNQPDEQKMVLAYKFDIYATDPVSRDYVYVDAATGVVVHRNAILKHADGPAATRYSGTRTIQTTLAGATHVLRDASRGAGIETYNLRKSFNFSTAIDFADADNDWTAAEHDNANKDNAALDAHWGAQRVYDYWKNVHGRLGIDGLDSKMKSYVHYGNNVDNAYWNGTAMLYGDGNTLFRPLSSLDVVAHEFGHGVMEYTANLVYQDEPGALNEGFSDIWGAVIESHAAPEKQRWLIGEEITLTTPSLRSMSNPNAERQPDTYKGQYWYTGTGDYGGVHYNSGVMNHWFYILTEGKTGTNDNGQPFAVTGIGMDKAANIAYRAQSVYLGANSKFGDARVACVQSAMDLYGDGSPEALQTANAWSAVGVNAPVALAALALSDTRIAVSWQVQPFGITGYVLFRSLSSTSGFAEVASLPIGTTTYTDTALVVGTTYYYKLRVDLGTQSSYFSAVQSLLLGQMAAPTALAATASGNTASLTWQDNSYNETNFMVERSLSPGGAFVQVAQLAAGTTSFQETLPTNVYDYRVRAFRSDLASYSGYTNVARVVLGNITVMSHAPVTTCDQLYLDPGAMGDYSINQDFTQTFTPATPHSVLRVVFNAFSLESGFDYLYIYNGASTSAPLIGTYSGTVSPGTITADNPTGQLTFRFTSDYSINRPGWSAAVSCLVLPVAQSQQLAGDEDQALPVTLTANDVPAPAYTLVALPQHGTLSGTAPDLTYTPDADFFGQDSLTFTVAANGFTSGEAVVRLTVRPINDAPSFVKGNNQAIDEDAGPQTVTAWATGLSAGPANESAQTLSISTVAAQPALFAVQPALSLDGTLTYTPAANASGTTTVTVTLADNGGGTNTSVQSFSILINAVNDVPVAVADAYQTTENTTLNVAAPGVLANDSDVENGPLSVVLVTGPVHGTLMLTGGNGSFSYTPVPYYHGPDSFSYLASDGTANGNTVTVTLTVVPVNDVPVVTSSLAAQTVQYSDPLAAVTLAATDSDSDPITVSTGWKLSGAASFTAGLPAGLTLTAGVPYTWTLAGKPLVAPGTYIVRMTANDGTGLPNSSGFTEITLTVAPENAVATYTGTTFTFTSGTSATTASVLLGATLQDISAASPATDGHPGDIRKASFQFGIYRVTTTGEIFVRNVPVASLAYVNAADTRTATATASTTLDIGGSDAATFKIYLLVGGHYAENPAAFESVTVSKPLSDFVTGGGAVWPSAMAGLLAGPGIAADKTSFSLSVKYTKNGGNPKGFVNLFIRRKVNGVPQVLQVRSNAFATFGVQRGTPAKATVVTKANVQQITADGTLDWGGNYTVQLSILDNGSPGTKDLIGITVYDKDNGIWFAANWNGIRSAEQNLANGNLSINSSSSFGSAARTGLEAGPLALADAFAYPNPVGSRLTVETTGGPASLVRRTRVTDALGRTHLLDTHRITGENTLEISLDGLPVGLYLIRVQGEGLDKLLKVVKQ